MHWKCSVCNLLWHEDSPPESCPKCQSPGEKYEKLSAEAWQLIERSRFTNGLHTQLLCLIPRLKDLAEKGIEDDLDARCVALFKRVLEDVTYWENSSKAELNGHVNRGKWG